MRRSDGRLASLRYSYWRCPCLSIGSDPAANSQPASPKREVAQAAAPRRRRSTTAPRALPRRSAICARPCLRPSSRASIEELRYAYDMNDIKPDLGARPASDPVAHWKRISGDGEGREILAALSLVLDAGYVVLPLGADLENNRLYIWPYFAEVPLGKLTPSQEVELLRLVPPARGQEMKAKGKYTHWRMQSARTAPGTHSAKTTEPRNIVNQLMIATFKVLEMAGNARMCPHAAPLRVIGR